MSMVTSNVGTVLLVLRVQKSDDITVKDPHPPLCVQRCITV